MRSVGDWSQSGDTVQWTLIGEVITVSWRQGRLEQWKMSIGTPKNNDGYHYGVAGSGGVGTTMPGGTGISPTAVTRVT